MSSSVTLNNSSRFQKTFILLNSCFVLVLLSCGIANAQSPIAPEISTVPDGISAVSSAAPTASASQEAEDPAKPGTIAGTVMDRSGSVAAGASQRFHGQCRKPWGGLAPFGYLARHRGPRSPMPFGLAQREGLAPAADLGTTRDINNVMPEVGPKAQQLAAAMVRGTFGTRRWPAAG